MAELVNCAGEGLPLYLWGNMAEPGESAWEVGRRRAQREAGSFSYRNAVVVEADGRVVAALVGYPLPDAPEPIDYDRMPALFVPLQELENLAPRTWYVNVLATYAAYRGRGYGTRLLGIADQLAAATGRTGLSIIVSDANAGARRLYERCGYAEVAVRPMVKERWDESGRELGAPDQGRRRSGRHRVPVLDVADPAATAADRGTNEIAQDRWHHGRGAGPLRLAADGPPNDAGPRVRTPSGTLGRPKSEINLYEVPRASRSRRNGRQTGGLT